MVEILQAKMPPDLVENATLPGVRPVPDGRWLRTDDAYAEQMTYRRRLIAEQRNAVIWQQQSASDAVEELFHEAKTQLPGLGFRFSPGLVHCPDGFKVETSVDYPLMSLGQSVQEDICLLQKQDQEHALTAAVLCFPASWTLLEKAGKPLSRIHNPVAEYGARMTQRVQRLFDGVQVGKPLWRNNMLHYTDPDLHQPRSEFEPLRRESQHGSAGYIRAERQCILRLPKTRAVVFSIHSYVIKRG